MTNFIFIRSSYVLCMFSMLLSLSLANAFQTATQIEIPMRIDPIPIQEISNRLGLKKQQNTDSNAKVLISGSGPNMQYTLQNEHEVICPISGSHKGILCTATLSTPLESYNNANTIANKHELVSQVIMAGSLAASIRTTNPTTNSKYYLPYIITLVESLMAEEMNSVDLSQKMVFNSEGLETNEILVDWNNNSNPMLNTQDDSDSDDKSVMMFACNTSNDNVNSATSDIYILPPTNSVDGKVWRFSVEYKVATINLAQIRSFGDRDSTTPLKPDVWLKDDYY